LHPTSILRFYMPLLLVVDVEKRLRDL